MSNTITALEGNVLNWLPHHIYTLQIGKNGVWLASYLTIQLETARRSKDLRIQSKGLTTKGVCNRMGFIWLNSQIRKGFIQVVSMLHMLRAWSS